MCLRACENDLWIYHYFLWVWFFLGMKTMLILWGGLLTGIIGLTKQSGLLIIEFPKIWHQKGIFLSKDKPKGGEGKRKCCSHLKYPSSISRLFSSKARRGTLRFSNERTKHQKFNLFTLHIDNFFCFPRFWFQWRNWSRSRRMVLLRRRWSCCLRCCSVRSLITRPILRLPSPPPAMPKKPLLRRAFPFLVAGAGGPPLLSMFALIFKNY